MVISSLSTRVHNAYARFLAHNACAVGAWHINQIQLLNPEVNFIFNPDILQFTTFMHNFHTHFTTSYTQFPYIELQNCGWRQITQMHLPPYFIPAKSQTNRVMIGEQ
jgi:hypothetical protein